jgi:geranylgeranylglycerol-phosphate geranylgeranyltransferase
VADRAAALVELARPGNVLMAGVGALVGAIVAAGPGSWPATGAAALATGLVTGGGNALNDVTDRALDRRAHPQRPIPSGRLSTRAASLAAGVAFLLASGIAAWVSLELLGLVVAAEALLIAYEGLAKDRVLVGNLVMAALAGAVAVGELTGPVGFLAGLAFLANVAREIWKDDQDADHDVGRATFAQRYPRLAPRVAQAVTLGAIACSVLPLLAGFGGWPYALFVGLADAVFLAAVFADTSAIAQQRSKQAMMVALVAFALGGAL